MNASEAREYLLAKADPSYKDFSEGLSSKNIQHLGVRRPIVNELAKQLANDPEFNPEEIDKKDSLELMRLFLSVSLLRLSTFQEKMDFVEKNLRYCVDWELTDSVPHYIKAGEFDEYESYFLRFYKSKNLWKRRFAWVYCSRYRNQKKMLKVLKLMRQDKEYYVMMGEAWFLAEVAICFPDEVLKLLASDQIGIKLKRKAIDKMCDSYRVLEKVKRKAKNYRDIDM